VSHLVVVGDALLDRDLVGAASRLCPDAPVPVLEEQALLLRPGGAGLAALLAARDGHRVTLVTALAGDADGASLRGLLTGQVRLCAGRLRGGTPVKTRVRAGGQSLLRVDRGGAGGGVAAVPEEAVAAIGEADAVLVADYGRGMAAEPRVRAALARAAGRLPVVWDPHPRGAVPVPGARLVTPNLAEAAGFAGQPAGRGDLGSVGRVAAALVERWQAGAVAVTMGHRGALLSYGGELPLVVPVPAASTVDGPGSRLDSCGAGDRFAVTAAGLLAAGRLPSEAVVGAVSAATEFVLAGGAGTVRPGEAADPPPRRVGGAEAVVARTRARGGVVVATGGCFDLLHAGHVRLLGAARALGDCLVVCLNSDASVRRLKGPDRPVLGQTDRVRVLEALEYVDAAVVFEEDTPRAVLERLRPDVWAKGGDYAGMPLSESDVLAGWGGQAVLLPYVAGRSTSRLIEHCRALGSRAPDDGALDDGALDEPVGEHRRGERSGP
jgi:rfaE bifunctional protein nucleotidyltransferase chain/domain